MDTQNTKEEFSTLINAQKVQLSTSIDLKEIQKSGEIFYDAGYKVFLFRKNRLVVFTSAVPPLKTYSFEIPYEQIYLILLSKNLSNPVVYFLTSKLQIISKQILGMAVHQSNKYVIYSIVDSTLVLVKLSDLSKEQRIKIPGKVRGEKLLFFSWVYQKNLIGGERRIDLIVVEKSGVRLYQLIDDKSQLKELKHYEISCTASWYDSIGQVLLVSSLKENGKLYSFFFDERRAQLKYSGPEFYLEDNKKEKRSTAVFISLLQQIEQINQAKDSAISNQIKQSFGKDTLLSRAFRCQNWADEQDQMEGKILIYHLLFEKIMKLDLRITVPSDSPVSICIVEDLLVINSHQNMISMIYDLKRSNDVAPLGPPQPILLEGSENKFIYDRDVLILGDEQAIDLTEPGIYSLSVRLNLIRGVIPSDAECLNTILRRRNPKQEAIHFFKRTIEEQREVVHVSMLFRLVFEIYKEAQKESMRAESEGGNRNGEVSVRISQTKIRMGYTIIFPSELYTDLFAPIISEKKVSRSYMIDLLTQYLRLADFNEILQISKTQDLLVEVILQEKKYHVLHYLVQYKVLSDTSDLAKKLISLSALPQQVLTLQQNTTKKEDTSFFRPGFQQGIDMLFRLKKYYDILEIFFTYGMFVEALDLISRYSLYKLKAKQISIWVMQIEGNCSKKEVFGYFDYLMNSQVYQNHLKTLAQGSLNRFNFTINELKEEFKKQSDQLKQKDRQSLKIFDTRETRKFVSDSPTKLGSQLSQISPRGMNGDNLIEIKLEQKEIKQIQTKQFFKEKQSSDSSFSPTSIDKFTSQQISIEGPNPSLQNIQSHDSMPSEEFEDLGSKHFDAINHEKESQSLDGEIVALESDSDDSTLITDKVLNPIDSKQETVKTEGSSSDHNLDHIKQNDLKIENEPTNQEQKEQKLEETDEYLAKGID